ncbi:MAG TPA: AAA family ATPase [Pirellulales bacterium]|nr:AAA family ATPase [Pirellulales bacterium]
MAESLLDSILSRLANKQRSGADAQAAIDARRGATALLDSPREANEDDAEDTETENTDAGAPDTIGDKTDHDPSEEDRDEIADEHNGAAAEGAGDEGFVPSPALRSLLRVKPKPIALAPLPSDTFIPFEPKSFREAQLTESEVEALILKFLLSKGDVSGREMADQFKLPFILLDELLQQMKHDHLIVHRSAGAMNDYQYQMTEVGRERARRFVEHCTYFGAAPVTLQEYVASVKVQSLTNQHPTVDDLHRAFSDLLINPEMLTRLGPAINSGRGLFLYGGPGNGKTSIAERITKAFGQAIWIPRAIGIDGDILRLFDPTNHEELPVEETESLIDTRKIDKRWVRIRRPTIVVGGELTMDNLEVTLNTSTGISEAPVQLKSNCGTLVIDDFGRQKMRTDELLNRWIVPLEKRYDYLNLPSGKKIQVPFDQLIVFSTNLQPKDLVDDAFLRRIPYKIEVQNPSEAEFRDLFQILAPKFEMEFHPEALDYLVQKHYLAVNRPFRCCQPRDLLLQIKNYCHYQNVPPRMTPENFDYAVENYFAIL